MSKNINRCNKCGRFVSEGVDKCDNCSKQNQDWKKYLMEE